MDKMTIGFLRIVLSMTLLVLAQLCSAQQTVEVVHLKNGSMIKGMIIEQVPNESIKIQTSDGSVFVYQMSEVEKITKEVVLEKSTGSVSKIAAPLDRDRSGYVNVTELSYGIGMGDYSGTATLGGSSYDFQDANNDNYVRLTTANGIGLLDGMLSVGIGVGLEYYLNSEAMQLPIYADIRLMPISGDFSPSIILQGGYSVSIQESGGAVNNVVASGNGLEFAGGIGIDAAVSSRTSLLLSLLYDYQEFSSSYSYYYGGFNYSTQSVDYHGGALRVSVGLAF